MVEAGIELPSVSRNGNLLVVPRGAVLPSDCIKCGFPAGITVRQTYSWSEPLPWWFWLGSLIPALHVVQAVMPREKFELLVPICESHYGQRRKAWWIGWALIAGALVLGAFSADLLPDVSVGWRLLGMVAGVFAGAVFLTSGRSLLTVSRIDKQEASFVGAGQAFLAQLPPV